MSISQSGNSNEVDVVIVGAGPSGTSTAINLARAGKRVTIIDKAKFPRDKCCGDGLTTGALRQLEALGLDPKSISSWREIKQTVWRSPSGHSINLDVPEGEGTRIAVARRTELDAALVHLAREAGVTIHEGHALDSVEIEPMGIRVFAKDLDPIRAAYAIGADGMWSPLRRAVNSYVVGSASKDIDLDSLDSTSITNNLDTSINNSQASVARSASNGRYLGEIHAFRQYFRNVDGPAREHLWVSFEPDLLPGYMWSFPVGNGGVNIGFGIVRESGHSIQWMNKTWTDLMQRPHVREQLGPSAEPEASHKAWPIPAKVDIDLLTAANGRVLFVGDAARVVDPLTGEGIGQALETGRLAAEAMLAAGPGRSKFAAQKYRKSIRMGMAIDNAFARSLAQLVRHEAGARAVIRLAPNGPWRGKYALRWVFEDNPRAALLTPWRWKERFASKQGAYV